MVLAGGRVGPRYADSTMELYVTSTSHWARPYVAAMNCTCSAVSIAPVPDARSTSPTRTARSSTSATTASSVRSIGCSGVGAAVTASTVARRSPVRRWRYSVSLAILRVGDKVFLGQIGSGECRLECLVAERGDDLIVDDTECRGQDTRLFRVRGPRGLLFDHQHSVVVIHSLRIQRDARGGRPFPQRRQALSGAFRSTHLDVVARQRQQSVDVAGVEGVVPSEDGGDLRGTHGSNAIQ